MPFPHALDAAAILADAWRSGRQIDALPAELRPDSIEAGYDIQDALAQRIGEPVMGWKLGVGSTKAKAETGIGRAIAGRVFQSRLLGGGQAVNVPDRAPITIEFEFAYVLGRDIRPGEAPADAMDAVAETRLTFELVRARFVDRRAVGWPSFTADNAAFDTLVLGDVVRRQDLSAIAASVVVLADGAECARALSGDDVTMPEETLADFLALAAERGWALPKGTIVSTGTVTKPFNITGETTIVARYEGGELGFRTISAV